MLWPQSWPYSHTIIMDRIWAIGRTEYAMAHNFPLGDIKIFPFNCNLIAVEDVTRALFLPDWLAVSQPIIG